MLGRLRSLLRAPNSYTGYAQFVDEDVYAVLHAGPVRSGQPLACRLTYGFSLCLESQLSPGCFPYVVTGCGAAVG